MYVKCSQLKCVKYGKGKLYIVFQYDFYEICYVCYFNEISNYVVMGNEISIILMRNIYSTKLLPQKYFEVTCSHKELTIVSDYYLFKL